MFTHINFFKSHFFGLTNALFQSRYRTYFAAQPHFGGEAGLGRKGYIFGTGKDGRHYRQVKSGIGFEGVTILGVYAAGFVVLAFMR